MAFDINKLNFTAIADQGYEFKVKDPSGMYIDGAYITVRGALSPKVSSFKKALVNKMQQDEKRKKEQTLDDAERMSLDLAVLTVMDWRGFEADGKDVKCTEANVRELLSRETWLQEQIIAESNEAANFTSLKS